MDRRSFLQLLGVTAAAAIIEPQKLLAASEGRPGFLVNYLSLTHEGQTKVHAGQWITGLILPAPAGQKCRVEIRPAPKKIEGLISIVNGVLVGNEPAQVVLSRVGRPGSPNILAAKVDVSVLSGDGFMPVDWGSVAHYTPLEIDYEAFGDQDQHLFLGLMHNGYYTRAIPSHGCPPYLLGSDDD